MYKIKTEVPPSYFGGLCLLTAPVAGFKSIKTIYSPKHKNCFNNTTEPVQNGSELYCACVVQIKHSNKHNC